MRFFNKKACGKNCWKLVEMLKHYIVLKNNNVEMLKSMWKLLKSTANKAGWKVAAKSDGARRQSDQQAGLIKWSACGRESNGAPRLGKVPILKKLLQLSKISDIIQLRKEGVQNENAKSKWKSIQPLCKQRILQRKDKKICDSKWRKIPLLRPRCSKSNRLQWKFSVLCAIDNPIKNDKIKKGGETNERHRGNGAAPADSESAG